MIATDPVYEAPENNRYTLDPLSGYYFDNYTGQYLEDRGELAESLFTGEVSDAQNQENLRAASMQALNVAGLGDTQRGEWSGTDAANYTRALRNAILASPADFTAATVAIAQRINPERVADYSMSEPNKPIDPQLIIVGFTDMIQPIIDLLGPISQVPGSINKAANAILNVVNNAANAMESTSRAAPLLTLLVPAALVLWGVSLASRPIREARGIFA